MNNPEEDNRTTAQVMIDLLVDGWGVRHIFGIPGDGINPIMEAMRQRKDDVQFVQTRHEEAAAFAAVGYAKLTGRLGVCLATTGPGGVHLLNGLYDAKLDQVPVLAVTGLQYHDLIGQFYQQDIDLDRLMSDVAVYSQRVMGPASVDSITNLAVRSALSRRGVAHVTIPVDVQHMPRSSAQISTMGAPNHTSTAYAAPTVSPRAEDVHRAADVLNGASRVAILVGAGALAARDEVAQIADLLAAPVAKALLGKDVLPDDHPHVTGSIGVIGTKPTADAMEGCDALLMIGTSFPYVRYLPRTDGSVRGVQIDINPERIGIRFPIDVGLVGDAQETLRTLIPALQRKSDRGFLETIQGAMREWKATMESRQSDTSLPLRPPRLAHALGDALADDAVVICDSGTTAMWVARDLEIRSNQRFTVSGLLASMACSMPYSIGIQTAYPGRQVVSFVGDGGLAMLLGDLATLVKYDLPVKVVVLKNNVLGMIRWEQLMWVGNPEYGIELQNIDFVGLAEAMGMHAMRVERPQEVDNVVAQALRTPGPVLLEAMVDPYEPMLDGSVKPMQAEHVAQALTGGEVNAERITRSIYRYAQEDVPQNRDVLVETLQNRAGDLLAQAERDATDSPEPQATFASQAETALERTSGAKAAAERT